VGVNTGIIVAVSRSTEKGVRKTNVSEARLVENWGIEGDAHAGPGHRQISLLAIESIEKMRVLGLDVHPGDFAENITTGNMNLQLLSIGDRILIGEAELEITQFGKKCHSHCAIFEHVGDCVMPREGVFAIVIRGGTVRVGDPIRLVDVPLVARAQ
jgi:MOSC domain-containing protein YiiM